MPALERIEKLLWIGLLLLVPLSASPLLPLGAGTQVRPLAFIPALLLLLLWALRVLVLRQWPKPVRDGGAILAGFVLYAVLSGLCVVTLLPESAFKGQTPLDSFLRALLTMAVGLVFFAVARLRLRSAEDVRAALRWLFLGICLSVAMAALQLAAILHGGETLRMVQALTDLTAIHEEKLVNRAPGLTYEPSWLATQIVLLMLPPLVAWVISRQPAILAAPRRIGPALAGLGVALVGLLCAGSRFGLAAVLGMLLLGGMQAVRRGRLGAALALVAVLGLAGGGVAAMAAGNAGAGAGYVLGPLALLTSDTPITDFSANNLTDALSLPGRVAAAQAAFTLWWDHPLFGVSLGNNFRFFPRYAPDWAFETHIFSLGKKEGEAWLDPGAPDKANPKVLFLRLLSETGLIGFVLFAAFCWREVFGRPAQDSYYAAFRLAAGAALIFAAINQDSFADPAAWLLLALCSAMGRLQAPRDEDVPLADAVAA